LSISTVFARSSVFNGTEHVTVMLNARSQDALHVGAMRAQLI